MISVEIYSTVYFLLISIVVLLGIFPLFVSKKLEDFPKINLYVGTFLLLIIPILFIGFRDPYASFKYFGDTSKYTHDFLQQQKTMFLVGTKDIGFYFFMRFFSKYGTIQFFYFCSALLYVMPLYFAMKKWFKEYYYFALVFVVVSMSFWAFGINTMRNGIAVSLFLLGLSFKKDSKTAMFFLFFVAFWFHNSIILPIVAFIILQFVKQTKFLLVFWILSVIVSFFLGSFIEEYFTNILQSLNLYDDRAAGYLDNELDYNGIVVKSFRVDFVLYSLIPILFGLYYKNKTAIQDSFYNEIFNMYLFSNAIWLLLIYIPFTDRLAYLSWFLIPLIFVFPFVKDNFFRMNNYLLGLFVFVNLIFTLYINLK